MARVADPMGLPGMDEPAACPPGDGLDTDLETAGRGGRRGVIGWVLLVLASLAYAAASFMLAGLAVGLVPLTAESPAQGYLLSLIHI